MKILISDNLAKVGVELLKARGIFEVDFRPGMTAEELKAAIPEYEGLIVRSESRVTADIIAVADKLKVIGRAGSGVDNIDTKAATARGIVVMNAAAGNSVTTAEHTISLLMALARKIPQTHAKLKTGVWDKKSGMGVELQGKTVGVIGLGNIGRIVASRALGLAMKVVAFDPFLTKEAAAKAGIELGSLDDVFTRADFITVHTPLTDETRGIVGTAAFEKMKKGVRIINCARGGLVDEQALYDAIKSGKVAGAALDVFTKEPVNPDHPLLTLDEVVVTPHLGASTNEAQDSVAELISDEVANYLADGAIAGAVNVSSVTAEALKVIGPYITLGEKLGAFQTQYFDKPVSEIQINYSGEIAAHDVKPVTQAILAGLLAPFSARVNQVNASVIAAERGLRVTEAKQTQAQDYATLIDVIIKGEGGQAHVAGTLFGKDEIRIVEIDDYRVEAAPRGNMLIISNDDKPGVVGRIGTFLGEQGVNIAQLNLSRNRPGGLALSVYQVDEALNATKLAALAALPLVQSSKQIKL